MSRCGAAWKAVRDPEGTPVTTAGPGLEGNPIGPQASSLSHTIPWTSVASLFSIFFSTGLEEVMHEVKRLSRPFHIWALACCALALYGGSAFAQGRGGPPRQFELKAESPKFWDLFTEGSQLEKVATGFGFTEGPVWDRRGFLYVSDEQKNKISRVYPDGRVETLLEIGDPDGSTLDAHGHFITTASVLRAIIQVEPDGRYTVLADKFEGKRFNSPNDIVVGPDGALYFTDPTLDLPKGETQEIPFQGVYRLGSDGAVRLLTKDLNAPNGLAFSPDGKRLYINDTRQREIRVYDVGRGMELQNGRLFGKEEGSGGVPDGMRVDAAENVYCTGPGGVWVWDPEGNHIGTVMLPESTANFNWGDADYRTIYFSSRTSIYRLKTKAQGFVPSAAPAK
jgi:gluconolactonase